MTKSLRVARSAALAYTATFVAGSLISIKRDHVARPLGMQTGQGVRRDVLSGVGGGLAAPWSMIVCMWAATAISGKPGRAGRRGRAWLAFIAAMLLAGSVSEPVSHTMVSRDLPAPDMVVAVANIVIPFVMLGGALASLVDNKGSGQPR